MNLALIGVIFIVDYSFNSVKINNNKGVTMKISTIEQDLGKVWVIIKNILIIHIHIIEAAYNIVKNIIIAIIAGFSKKPVVTVNTTVNATATTVATGTTTN
jgi:hypothetical protein